MQIKNTHDSDKWRKKFVLVFNREKVIDFCGNGLTKPFEEKTMTLKLKALNKQGEKIMKTNAKFWIVYLKLV